MLTEPHVFPAKTPPYYEYLEREPRFDARRDLQLEPPKVSHTLQDLGYDERFRARFTSPLAITSPLRVLSDEGVANLREVLALLRPDAIVSADPTHPPVLRGAVFRSRFVRDLCLAPELSAFFSGIGGTALVPTSLPHQLAHFNYAAEPGGDPRFGWHYDENAFVMVMMLHDPRELSSGRFEYFAGPRHQALSQLAKGESVSRDQVVAPEFPGAGYAVLMQGSAIVHRAAPLTEPVEDRCTMVAGFDPTDVRLPDPNRLYFVRGQEEHARVPAMHAEQSCRYADFARHKAWRVRGRLDDLIRDLPWSEDPKVVAAMFGDALKEAVEALAQLHKGDVSTEEMLRQRATAEQRTEQWLA